jgi:hypothetical protein
MSEYFRMASIADYEPNIPPRGAIGTSRSSLLVRDDVTFDDFTAAMLLGAKFRTASRVAVGFVPATQFSKSSENVETALQPSNLPLQRQYFALMQSRNGSITPSRAEGVANHATSRI